MSQTQLAKFLPQLEDEGIKMVYIDPKKLAKNKKRSIYDYDNRIKRTFDLIGASTVLEIYESESSAIAAF